MAAPLPTARPSVLRIIVAGTMALLAASLGFQVAGGLVPATAAASQTLHPAASPLAGGTYCQGPQPSEPATGPTKVIMIELENESSTSISASPDAPFENGTLAKQCGNFQATAMHSTTHPSESNYFAEVSGLNASINSGNDALARFGLSDCPPDSTSSACVYGGGHFASTVPSLFSQIEAQYGTTGWKTYADNMPQACDKADGDVYVKTPTTSYPDYVTRHNPAVFFNGIACAAQDVPSGNWQGGQGALYSDLMSGSIPQFSFIEPNDQENGHDPVSVNGVTVAGGVSQVGNIDNYLSSLLPIIQSSPDYESGNLVVMITFDEGTKAGPIAGEDTVGENCADPNISPLATSCQVQTWIVGRYVPSITYSTYMNQFGLLSATERILGLSPLLGHAGDASTPDIVDGTTTNPNPFNLAPTSGQTVPGAPTIGSATAGNASATVSFSPGLSGGSPISSYQVTASPGGATATGAGSPITVAGLANGTSYTFTVTATNGIGTGPPSVASNSVVPTPPTVPGAPSGLTATGSNSSAQLSWAAPGSTGGAPITDYAVQFRLTGTVAWQSAPDPNSTATTATVTGLTNGSGYDFQVSATNSVGTGAPSAVATATPTASGPELLPDPGFEHGVGGWTPFSVGTFTSVTSPVHGGSAALRIAATGPAAALVGMTQNSVVGNSVAGTTYTAQCYVQPTSANLNVQLRFLEYTQNFATDIHLQTTTISALPTSAWTLVSVSSVAVNSGERMIPQIYSSNETTTTGSLIYDDCSVRTGGQAPVITAPSAPTSVTATATDGAASVAFAAPSSTGGSPVTLYTVTASPGGATATGTASPIAVTGLTDGTRYTFVVTATNAVGTGPASAASNAVTPAGIPAAPLTPTVSPGDGQVGLSWNAPSASGSPITDYVVQYRPTGTDGWITAADGVSTLTSATVSGLTDATSYDFQVAAVNAVGTGGFSPINTATPVAGTAPELLPDPGFEAGNGGWVAFTVGTLSRVSSPVRSGLFALQVAAVGASANLVGLTQNTVIKQTVAGTNYNAQCYVQPTSANLNVQIRFLEYTQNLSSDIHLQTTTISKLPVGVWTLVKVSSVAVNSGERLIPQIYSTNETTGTGSLIYDDCSVTIG